MNITNTLHVTILQHSDGSPPGTVLDWIKAKGYVVKTIRLDRGEALPKIDEIDRLVIMGGPMNVDDIHLHPWLIEEKKFIRAAVDANKPVLGICLGGQLLSQVLGGTVKPNKHWEAGWHKVKLEGLKNSPRELTVFQWHQDTFSTPPGAVRFATNEITENQGFTYKNAIGFQFHPEADEAWIRQQAFEKKYPSGPFVQEQTTVIDGLRYQPAMKDWFFELLDERLG